MKKVILLVVIAAIFALAGCKDDKRALEEKLNSVAIAFAAADYSHASERLADAQQLYVKRIGEWPLCVSDYFHVVDGLIAPVAKWHINKGIDEARALTRALEENKPLNRVFGHIGNRHRCGTDISDGTFLVIASAREFYELKNEAWRSEAKALYPEAVAETLKRIADDNSYAEYQFKDKQRSWNVLSGDDKNAYTDDDRAVRSCMDEALSDTRASAGVSKREIADACQKLLKRSGLR